MNKLPQAKTDNIVVQDLGNELLVYNLTTHKAYTLNETSKIVFESCDGKQTFDELKRRHKFTDDLIHLALDELKANDLLVDYQMNHFGDLSRREVIRRVGLTCAVALPVIAGITAPSAASAASTCSDQSNGINDPNGTHTRGQTCTCRINANGQFQPCNTTRGGLPDPSTGCQSGCLCQYSGVPCPNDICLGRCG